MLSNQSIPLTTVKSKSLTALQALQKKHWERLNTCHLCKTTAGKHTKLIAGTFKEATLSTYLINCQHGLKCCNICMSKHYDIQMANPTKAEKKHQRKRRIIALKAERSGDPQP